MFGAAALEDIETEARKIYIPGNSNVIDVDICNDQHKAVVCATNLIYLDHGRCCRDVIQTVAGGWSRKPACCA